jgi:hypothetical protein
MEVGFLGQQALLEFLISRRNDDVTIMIRSLDAGLQQSWSSN